MQIVVTVYCLGENGKKKYVHIQYIVFFFFLIFSIHDVELTGQLYMFMFILVCLDSNFRYLLTLCSTFSSLEIL